MAIRVQGSADGALYTGGAPSGDYTMMVRIILVATPGFKNFLYIGSNTDFTLAVLVAVNGVSAYEVYALSSSAVITVGNVALGREYHVTLVGNTTPSTPIWLYVDGVLIGTGTSGANTYSAQRVHVGNNYVTQFFDGRLRGFKLWNAKLSQAEIYLERLSLRARRRAGLYMENPLFTSDASETLTPDLSGFGRHMTLGGTTATENTGFAWTPLNPRLPDEYIAEEPDDLSWLPRSSPPIRQPVVMLPSGVIRA